MVPLADPTRTVDRVAAALLERAGVAGPPVDAFVVAARNGVRVAVDESLSVRARTTRLPGGAAVLLQPDDRPERLQWALAHELGELHAWRHCEATGGAADDLDDDDRERIANDFAARLLLPSHWFDAAVAATDGDLFALKATFATASHELIALRRLDLADPCVVTVFDNGRLFRRRSNRAAVPLQPLERLVRELCHATAIPGEQSAAGLRVRSWPIHEPGWRREIVVTTPVEPE